MKKLVVVEDNTDIRSFLVNLLEISGYNVEAAENGFIGIQKIIEHTPDLVLCDIVMPQLDGYEVLKSIRKNPILANTPFIFLSSMSDSSDVRTGMELGADDYLTKPVDPEHLLKSIETRIKRNKIVEEEIEQKVQKIKKNLSSVYSHEVNTPLNGIIGLTDILLRYYKTSMPKNMAEMVTHIKKASIRLYRTTNNLLRYADLQQYDGIDEKYPIGHICSYSNALTKKILEIAEKYERKDDLDILLENCDLNMSESDLEIVAIEAVDNAFKFSELGTKVCVNAKIDGEFLIFSVNDKGEGIDEINMEEIDSFVQFNREKNEQQGLGLGLYMIKRILQLNKCKFEIVSKTNKGTTITVKIPVKV